MSEEKVFDYEGCVSALDKAESLGCPDLKDWEGQLDAIKDNGLDRYDDVDEFESIAPAERANLPTNVLTIPDQNWTASSATPGWFILELTNPATGLVDSYVKSPDGRIWGDDQVEDVVEGML